MKGMVVFLSFFCYKMMWEWIMPEYSLVQYCFPKVSNAVCQISSRGN